MELKTIDNKISNLSKAIDNLNIKTLGKIQNMENKLNDLHVISGRPEAYESFNEASDYLNDNIKEGDKYAMEQKSLTSNKEEGEELIAPHFNKNIIARLSEFSVMRKIANIQTISSNALEIIIQNGKFTGGWVKEQGEREETAAAKFERKIIFAHELFAQPKASQRLLDDSEIDIQKWLTDQVISTFAELEDASFINGEGESSPKGILKYKSSEINQIKSQEQNKIGIIDLLNLINSLDEQYLSKACFLMHRTTLASLQNLQDNNGRFIWQPALNQTRLDSLFGLPVLCSSHMPIIEENNLAVAIGDFKSAYTIVDKKHISLMKDPYTEKPFVKFYVTKRVGGDVVNVNAIKLLKV